MAARYKWTTGPVNSSKPTENIIVVVLNNSVYNQKLFVNLYNLGLRPKKKVYSETIYIDPEVTVTVNIPTKELNLWEIQAISFSKRVQFYISGREENSNEISYSILHSQLIQL